MNQNQNHDENIVAIVERNFNPKYRLNVETFLFGRLEEKGCNSTTI